ncbi:MAG TPA: SprT-like domain-containing protein [Polyangiaceae bacterium]|nr:SprT-like domain-containing protein [Polyangiaceae bacterium]
MTVRAEGERLSAELLRQALREVERAYREFNQVYFASKLRLPQLEWTELQGELGAWVRVPRSLRLGESLLQSSWGELLEVLKHEMAHQFVDEVLNVRDEGPHGPTFRRVCAERGIDGRARGATQAQEETPERTAVLGRIARLLSLAQSDNQHEAEAAMAAARRLMLKYNLEQADASRERSYSFRHVGRPTGRRAAWQRVLGSLLGEYFFVDVIIVPVYRPAEGKRGSVLELMGTVENLEIASYVHDFLERAAEALWRSHKKQDGVSSDRERQSYLFGVMSGFREKLSREGKQAQSEGLVWRGDAALTGYAKSRHPYQRSVSSSGRVHSAAFSAGREAGQALVLHRGLNAGSSGSAPRLLGGRTGR